MILSSGAAVAVWGDDARAIARTPHHPGEIAPVRTGNTPAEYVVQGEVLEREVRPAYGYANYSTVSTYTPPYRAAEQPPRMNLPRHAIASYHKAARVLDDEERTALVDDYA